MGQQTVKNNKHLVPVKEAVDMAPGDDGQRIQDAVNAVAKMPLVN